MAAKLLIIDPQNDFMDIEGAALPVPGASADMQRLARFIKDMQQMSPEGTLKDIILTLDSHPQVAIERTTFWKRADGNPVAPFTQITEADVRAGEYLPRDVSHLPATLSYLHELESAGRYRLMVWPVHCVTGTWGHNIYSPLQVELSRWEEHAQRGAFKVLKGTNPLTEAYSAVRAEVPVKEDPSTQTNHALLSRVWPGKDTLIVAGEASSHCVAATLRHLLEVLRIGQMGHVVLLSDCTSPVAGFEAQQESFFNEVSQLGVRIMTSTEAVALFH